jgi:hypothetical protein
MAKAVSFAAGTEYRRTMDAMKTAVVATVPD